MNDESQITFNQLKERVNTLIIIHYHKENLESRAHAITFCLQNEQKKINNNLFVGIIILESTAIKIESH